MVTTTPAPSLHTLPQRQPLRSESEFTRLVPEQMDWCPFRKLIALETNSIPRNTCRFRRTPAEGLQKLAMVNSSARLIPEVWKRFSARSIVWRRPKWMFARFSIIRTTFSGWSERESFCWESALFWEKLFGGAHREFLAAVCVAASCPGTSSGYSDGPRRSARAPTPRTNVCFQGCALFAGHALSP